MDARVVVVLLLGTAGMVGAATGGRGLQALLSGLLAVCVALGLGVGVGFIVAWVPPAIPDVRRALGPLASDPISAALVSGALAVLVVPFGMYVVYQLFFLSER
jgi:hypothetical protein